MLQYTNSFYCSYNKEQDNLIIRFRQSEPKPDDTDKDITQVKTASDVEMHEIISLIMDGDFAKKLVAAIQDVTTV